MSSDTLLLGTRKGLLRFRRFAAGWKQDGHFHPGLAVAYAVRDGRTGALWCCIDTGHWGQRLERSNDDGATWCKPGQPAYPEGAETAPGKPATLQYLWVLQPGPADRPGVLYAGTEPGGLFRSRDDGDNWELVSGLWNHPSRTEHWFGGGRDGAGIHTILIDPRDADRILVGVSCGGVFETRDGGESWTGRNRGLVADFLPNPSAEYGHDPHCLAACGADFDTLWMQNHCGIFRSTDGAESWTAASRKGSTAHFGFPVVADDRNPAAAWVVPALSDEVRTAVGGALAVCRTRDAGATWEELRNGLPQEGCYDVVYRHALDRSGETLAFGSTTGNVYLSEDGGESWIALGNHLPPVYSVRFA